MTLSVVKLPGATVQHLDMSRGPGRWQREALAVLEQELKFGEIAARLNASTRSERTALRRALDRSVATGQLGKRAGKHMFGGPRDIVWFRLT
jgi:hypothetical protein